MGSRKVLFDGKAAQNRGFQADVASIEPFWCQGEEPLGPDSPRRQSVSVRLE